MNRRLAATLLLLALAPPSHAEVENCMVIDSVPTTLTTQGLYCFTEDQVSQIATGAAITVAANNITIDCNGFKLGGLVAGDETRANGIQAVNRLNTVIRHCSIRGFHYGVRLEGGGGHVVEDNRFDANTYSAIGVLATDGDIIRRNHVVDTGGNEPIDEVPEGAVFAIALQDATGAQLDENTVVNTFASAGSGQSAHGIALFDSRGILRDNNVQNLLADGAGITYGIYLANSVVDARGNSLTNTGVAGHGISATASSYCADNHSIGFTTSMFDACTDGGGNGGL